MSSVASDPVTSSSISGMMKPGLSSDELGRLLEGRFGLKRDPRTLQDLCLLCPSAQLREVVSFLRDDVSLRFATVLDIIGVDYLAFPDHRGPRFAVVYLFKSVEFRQRVALKVEIEEDLASVPSITDLYLSANWAEREVWDQYGITFIGHPNPSKRLLNHHEFIGHPLRKDYPCQKRQKLSINDPMIDQLEERLKERGYTVIDPGNTNESKPITPRQGGAS